MSKIAHIRKITEVSDLDSEQEKITKYRKRVQLLQNYLNILRLQSADNKNQLDKYQDTYLQQQTYANELLANKAQSDMQIQDIINQTELERNKLSKLQGKLETERKRLERLTVYQQTLFKREKKIEVLTTHAKVYKKTVKAIRERVKEISILLRLDKYVKQHEEKKKNQSQQPYSVNNKLPTNQFDENIDTQVTAIFTKEQLVQQDNIAVSQTAFIADKKKTTSKSKDRNKTVKQKSKQDDDLISDSKINAMEQEFQRFKEDLIVQVSDQFTDSKFQQLQQQAQEGISKLQSAENQDHDPNIINVNPLIDHKLQDTDDKIASSQQIIEQKPLNFTQHEQQLQLEHEFKQQINQYQEKVPEFLIPNNLSNAESTNLATVINPDLNQPTYNSVSVIPQYQQSGNQIIFNDTAQIPHTMTQVRQSTIGTTQPNYQYPNQQIYQSQLNQTQHVSLQPQVAVSNSVPQNLSKTTLNKSHYYQNSYVNQPIQQMSRTQPVYQINVNDTSPIISNPQDSFDEQIATRVTNMIERRVDDRLPSPDSLPTDMHELQVTSGKNRIQVQAVDKSYKSLKPVSVARPGQKIIPMNIDQLTDTLQGLADGCRLIKSRSQSATRANSALKRPPKKKSLIQRVKNMAIDVLVEQSNVQEQLRNFHDIEEKRLSSQGLRNAQSKKVHTTSGQKRSTSAKCRKEQRGKLERALDRLMLLRHKLASVDVKNRRDATVAANLRRLAAAQLKELQALGCTLPLKYVQDI